MAELNPQILITAKDEASKVLRDVGNEAKKTGEGFGKQLKDGLIQAGAAFAGVSAFAGSMINSFSESQNTLAQLDAVLRSTKNAAGVTREEAIKLASAWQQQSKFSDEAILSGENMLLTFTNIGKNIFPQATETILNMSQALGQDLKSSSIQLGKALQDPILGVTALRRVGVAFTEQQQEQIKALVESGNLLKAQKMILTELGTEFGGSALASSKTFSGQMIILKNNLDDVQETLGKGMLDALSGLGGGFDNINAQIIRLNEFLMAHKDVLMAVSVAILALVVTFGVLFVAALIAAAGAVGVFIAIGGALVAVIAATATMIITNWGNIQKFAVEIWGSITKTVSDTWDAIMAKIMAVGMAIQGFITTSLEVLRGMWQGFVVAVLLLADFLTGGLVSKTMDWIIKNKANIAQFISEITAGVTAFTTWWINQFQAMGQLIVQGFNDKLNQARQVWDSFSNAVSGIVNGLQNIIQNFVNTISNLINNFRPNIHIGIDLPDIEGAWRSMKDKARRLGIPGFQTGGIVPGPIGQPQLIMAHGGEEIVPHRGESSTGGGGGQVSFNVTVGLFAGSELEKRRIAEELYKALVVYAGTQNKTVSGMLGG